MLDRSSRAISPSPSGHSCSSACMIEEEHVRHPRSLRRHPQSWYQGAYDEIILPSAPPSVLTSSSRSTSYSPEPPSPLEDAPPISHQRSLTATFLDKVKIPPIVTQTASRASLHSPTRSLSQFISSRSTPDEDTAPRSPSKNKQGPLFSDWFTGTSAPVNLGLIPSPSRDLSPFRESDDYISADMDSTYTSRPTRPRRSSTTNSQSQSTGFASKLSWFTKSVSPASPSQCRPSTSAAIDPSDDLLTLSISAALLPHGTPDILAPSSFHDLLSTSELLLSRYQAAYRAKATALADLRAEKDAQAEELEEAETRARHLKMQLDDMAEKAKAQEEEMRALSLELLAERRRREDEEIARRKSIQMVRGKDNRAGMRRGTSSSGSVSDSGFESDTDSAVGSVGSSFNSSPTLAKQEPEYDERRSGNERPLGQRRMSTYDTVLKTVAGEPAGAWAVMEGYREENRALRERVRELEGAVDGCLDMVAGLGI
ncbi:hypothetical protein NA57DRAFT_80900 [Rhizodiscina lignyota]|uniref:Uncharacterized protein n=1 Tax=Rhizodiscina lignyota TaxID=1504668 RepID=A0A9P4M437_9PEZI|nr:hypothetical protein NA57DRAFT_80900 [Rhizodiscina lignyota]